MSPSPSFGIHLVSLIAGVLFVVANIAFVTIPYALGGHPGEAVVTTANAPEFHAS